MGAAGGERGERGSGAAGAAVMVAGGNGPDSNLGFSSWTLAEWVWEEVGGAPGCQRVKALQAQGHIEPCPGPRVSQASAC